MITKEIEKLVDSNDKYKVIGHFYSLYYCYTIVYEEDNTTILLSVYDRDTQEMNEFYVFRGLNSLCDLLSFFRKNEIRFEEVRGNRDFIASIINELFEGA